MTYQGPIAPAASPPLPMWTIYDHPSDAPDCYIARKWLMRAGIAEATAETIRDPDLEMIRRRMRLAGLTCLARQPADDPCIVECWI